MPFMCEKKQQLELLIILLKVSTRELEPDQFVFFQAF